MLSNRASAASACPRAMAVPIEVAPRPTVRERNCIGLEATNGVQTCKKNQEPFCLQRMLAPTGPDRPRLRNEPNDERTTTNDEHRAERLVAPHPPIPYNKDDPADRWKYASAHEVSIPISR